MLAVTGANGHLGMRLLKAWGGRIRALVRSEGAAAQVRNQSLGASLDVRIVNYHDANDLAEALGGCTAVVHLVGIIRENAGSRYVDAHQGSCTALAQAAATAGLERMVYLSILGAAPTSDNTCLASRGAAERILMDAAVPVTVIRVPMVLGEDDFAARALGARARRNCNLVLRGSSLEQPIYAGDVVAAVQSALTADEPDRTYDLAGPESLTRTSLIHRAARVLGRRTRVLSLPLEWGLWLALLMEKVSTSPPLTRAMLGVLDHDDRIDPQQAVAALGLTLTSLDETLRRCLGGAAAAP
jgi:NADH dehydrogenase